MCRRCDREDDIRERQLDWGGKEEAQVMLAQAVKASVYYSKVGDLARAFEEAKRANDLEDYLATLDSGEIND